MWRTSSGWSTKVHLCLAAVDEARFSLQGGCAPEYRKARESTQPHKNQTTHQREALQTEVPLMVAIAPSRCPRASRLSSKRNLAYLPQQTYEQHLRRRLDKKREKTLMINGVKRKKE